MSYQIIGDELILTIKNFINKISIRDKTDVMLKGREVVTEYDGALEKELIAVILKHFPTHTIISEEDFKPDLDCSGFTWYIDPIDNTVGFIAGEREVVTSISLKDGLEHVFSIVYRWNDGHFGRSDHFNPTNTIIELDQRTHGVSTCVYVSQPKHDRFNGLMNAMLSKRVPIRMSGSASHDLLLVSEGLRAAHVSLGAHSWDIEGGLHLVKLNGGEIIRELVDEKSQVYAFIAGVNKSVTDDLYKLIGSFLFETELSKLEYIK